MVGFRFPGSLHHLLDIVSLTRILDIVRWSDIYIYCYSVRQFVTVRVLRPMAKALGVKGQKIVRFTERTSRLLVRTS